MIFSTVRPTYALTVMISKYHNIFWACTFTPPFDTRAKMSTVSFIVVVEKATGLRNAGGILGTSDPYAKISTPMSPALLNEQTEVVRNNLNPVWDCCMLVALPESVPAMLKLEVFDSNTGTLVNGTDVSLQNLRFSTSFDVFVDACQHLWWLYGMVYGRWRWASLPLTSPPAWATLPAGLRFPKCSAETPRRKAQWRCEYGLTKISLWKSWRALSFVTRMGKGGSISLIGGGGSNRCREGCIFDWGIEGIERAEINLL